MEIKELTLMEFKKLCKDNKLVKLDDNSIKEGEFFTSKLKVENRLYIYRGLGTVDYNVFCELKKDDINYGEENTMEFNI